VREPHESNSLPERITAIYRATAPKGTLAELRRLRALEGAVDPDVELLGQLIESQATFLLGAGAGAVAALMVIRHDQRSVFWRDRSSSSRAC
jgi:hypothetical protein